MATRLAADARGIAAAAAALRRGELVAFPTETVYGLGADARDDAAVTRIFTAKGRPADHPVIVHVASSAGLDAWGRAITGDARRLARAFWPGPLTLIVARAADVSDRVTGGQDSVGLRCPSHRAARALLAAFGEGRPEAGIAAPSANQFGRISPTRADHVLEDFADRELLVLDDGASLFGVESTIVDVSRPEQGPVLLRPGAITRAQLEAVLGRDVAQGGAGAPRVSGALASHYAPRKPLRLLDASAIGALAPRAATVALLSPAEPPFAAALAWYERAAGDPAQFAHRLYDRLRAMDASPASELVVQRVPDDPAWAAVADRLARAAAGTRCGDLDR